MQGFSYPNVRRKFQCSTTILCHLQFRRYRDHILLSHSWDDMVQEAMSVQQDLSLNAYSAFICTRKCSIWTLLTQDMN